MSRLNELLQQAGNIGRNEDGSITRLGFSEGYFQALELLKARMKEIGMQVETDPVGNLHGVLPGSDPEAKAIVIGSHLDTVIKGGVYDGMLGDRCNGSCSSFKGRRPYTASSIGNLGI